MLLPGQSNPSPLLNGLLQNLTLVSNPPSQDLEQGAMRTAVLSSLQPPFTASWEQEKKWHTCDIYTFLENMKNIKKVVINDSLLWFISYCGNYNNTVLTANVPTILLNLWQRHLTKLAISCCTGRSAFLVGDNIASFAIFAIQCWGKHLVLTAPKKWSAVVEFPISGWKRFIGFIKNIMFLASFAWKQWGCSQQILSKQGWVSTRVSLIGQTPHGLVQNRLLEVCPCPQLSVQVDHCSHSESAPTRKEISHVILFCNID